MTSASGWESWTPERERREERAAILEFDAGMRRIDAELAVASPTEATRAEQLTIGGA